MPSAGPGQPTPQPYPGAAQPYPGPAQPGATPPPYPGSAQSYPNQPNPGQPYLGQPYGAQPNPGQAYPPPPGAMPGQPPTGVPPKRSNKTILLIGAGVVAVIIVIAVIVAMLPKAGTNDPSGGGLPAPAKSGTEAVRGYLEALAASDSAAALSYADQPPSDTTLLTDEVLTASNAVAPITDIQISEPAGKFKPIPVTYMLGDKPVNTEYLATDASGSWKIYDVTADILLIDMNGVPIAINGVPVTDTEVAVFPGAYTATTTNELYKVKGGTFLIDSPTRFTPPTMQLDLSSTGQQRLRAAAQKQLNHCLDQTSLAPKGCGFSIRANGTGAVKAKWSIRSGKNVMKNADFRLQFGAPSSAWAYTSVGLNVKGYNKAGSYVGKGTASISRANAEVSGNTVSVTFE